MRRCVPRCLGGDAESAVGDWRFRFLGTSNERRLLVRVSCDPRAVEEDDSDADGGVRGRAGGGKPLWDSRRRRKQ